MMFFTVFVIENICPNLVLIQKPLDLQPYALPSELSTLVVTTCVSLYDSDMIIIIYQFVM